MCYNITWNCNTSKAIGGHRKMFYLRVRHPCWTLHPRWRWRWPDRESGPGIWRAGPATAWDTPWETSDMETMRCHENIIDFSKLWGVHCEFKALSMFYVSYCIVIFNTTLCRTTLYGTWLQSGVWKKISRSILSYVGHCWPVQILHCHHKLWLNANQIEVKQKI